MENKIEKAKLMIREELSHIINNRFPRMYTSDVKGFLNDLYKVLNTDEKQNIVFSSTVVVEHKEKT